MEQSNAQLFMKKNNLLAIILIFFIFLGVFFLYFQVVNEKVLILKNTDENKESNIIVEDGKFVLGFIHSVHHTPVQELYFIDNKGGLNLVETRYYSLGVGMPTEAENGFVNENGEFVLKINRRYEKIHLKVSAIPDHTIKVNDKVYSLLAFVKPEKTIELKAQSHWKIRKK